MFALQEAARPYHQAGLELLRRGLLSAAANRFGHELALVESSGDALLVLPPLGALAEAAEGRRDYDSALGWLDRALPWLVDPRVDLVDRLRIRIARIRVLTRLSRLDEALAAASDVPALVDRARNRLLAGPAWLDVGKLYVQRQEWTLAMGAAETALQHARTVGDQALRAQSQWLLGLAALELGHRPAAEQVLLEGLGVARSIGAREAPILIQLGRLALSQGDVQAALSHGLEALDALCKEICLLDKEEVADVSLLLGALFAEVGERTLALRYLNRAAAYYSQLGRILQWRGATRRLAYALKVTPGRSAVALREGILRLDLLTGLLDLTDELEAVDPYLRGQSERVASVAVRLGEAVGLDERQLWALQFAGRLHDVGMVAVDEDIRHKAGQLTPGERLRVQRHPVIGAEMTRPFGLTEEGVQAIRHHHEHWDGSGYPDGIAGEAIPLLARMLSVVDVYDALTSQRVYRDALSHDRALAQLRRMADRVLDPHLVERFVYLHHVEGVSTPC